MVSRYAIQFDGDATETRSGLQVTIKERDIVGVTSSCRRDIYLMAVVESSTG